MFKSTFSDTAVQPHVFIYGKLFSWAIRIVEYKSDPPSIYLRSMNILITNISFCLGEMLFATKRRTGLDIIHKKDKLIPMVNIHGGCRTLVAALNFWTVGFENIVQVMNDVGIDWIWKYGGLQEVTVRLHSMFTGIFLWII